MYGIFANVITDKVFRYGAKVLVQWCNGDGERPFAFGMSKGGRMVKKYTHYNHLVNYRAKWLTEGERKHSFMKWEDRNEAHRVAEDLNARWPKKPGGPS